MIFKLASIKIFLYTFAEMFPKFTGVKQNDSPKERLQVS